jgi:hypothetical protein
VSEEYISVIEAGVDSVRFFCRDELLARVEVDGPGAYDWTNRSTDPVYVAPVLYVGEALLWRMTPSWVGHGDVYRVTLK